MSPLKSSIYIGHVSPPIVTGKHWRNRFEGKHCFQVFFHYVTDKYKHLLFDERPMLGIPYSSGKKK